MLKSNNTVAGVTPSSVCPTDSQLPPKGEAIRSKQAKRFFLGILLWAYKDSGKYHFQGMLFYHPSGSSAAKTSIGIARIRLPVIFCAMIRA